MHWSKRHPGARFDLAGSNLLPCTHDELPGLFDGVDYSGDNDDGYSPLIEAIARHHGVAAKNIAVAPGASGANFMACVALLGPGDDAVLESPGYDPIAGAARTAGSRVIHFERVFDEAWRVVIERVESVITERTRLIALTSPHNPSGVVTDTDTLRALGELASRRDALVLVDEAYSRDASRTAAKVHDACVSTGSLTKSYGLAGLRCGWAIARLDVAERIRRARDVVDAVGVYAAEVASARAFERIGFLSRRARGIVEGNLELLREFMAGSTQLEWVAPAAGTVAFPRIRGVADTEPLAERLLRDYDTAVVPGRLFGAPAHFRIAYGVAPETLGAGLARIAAALDATAT
jgi:aspartate/methionine/tyrosine aminotransferase